MVFKEGIHRFSLTLLTAQELQKLVDRSTPELARPVATPQSHTQASVGEASPASTIPGSIPTKMDSDEEFIDTRVPPAHLMIQPDRQPEFASPLPTPSDKSQRNFDGTQSVQPVAEPFAELGLKDDDIPDLSDAFAPRFHPGEHHLSQEAIRSRAKRIFTPRIDGSKKVSDEIWNDWKAKGKRRSLLQDIFKQCGYDPETCLKGRKYFVILIPVFPPALGDKPRYVH